MHVNGQFRFLRVLDGLAHYAGIRLYVEEATTSSVRCLLEASHDGWNEFILPEWQLIAQAGVMEAQALLSGARITNRQYRVTITGIQAVVSDTHSNDVRVAA